MKDRTVGIIGAGRVGTALGLTFARAGYQLVGVSARSEAARQRAATVLADVPILAPSSVAETCDILLVAVPDDAIAPVTRDLATAGCIRSGQFILHPSGAHGLHALDAAADAGAVPLAIHPAMTFPGLPSDADNLANVAYAVTARPAERQAAEELVHALGGVPVWIADECRTLYHAGLVLGANNLIGLISAAMEALHLAGVNDPGLVLAPLVRTSLENALRLGDQALTGPVRRADTGTITAHLRALDERTPHLSEGYVQASLITAYRAKAAALHDAAALDHVIRLLERTASEHRARGSEGGRGSA